MQEQTTGQNFQAGDHVRTRHLSGVPVEQARARLRSSLLAAGFTTMADVDLADLLNRRLDEHLEPYFLVDACHPWLARQALAVAWDGGLLMPTRFGVWKAGPGSAIATVDPLRLAAAIGLPHLADVAAGIAERLDRVFEKLDEPSPAGLAAELPAPPETELTASERGTLREAARRHLDEMLDEVARTESRPLQHQLAQAIDRLEQAVRKLETPLP
jgi:uncharacterized protein (DUF302 family)